MNFLEPNADRCKRISHDLRWHESVKKEIEILRAEIAAFHEKKSHATKRVRNDESSIGEFIFLSPFVNGLNSASVAERVAKKRRTASSIESDGKRSSRGMLLPVVPSLAFV